MKKIKIRVVEMGRNQYIIDERDYITFQSYNSIIAFVDLKNRKLTIGERWDYSQTTLKYLYKFIDEHIYILGKDEETKKQFNDLFNKSNKKEYIKKLIKNKVIKYDEKLY